MNDVNDFMAKFGNDFEIKWGVAVDPELGKKVKVTILATGFGIEDVDGMNIHLSNKRTQEESDRIAQEAEKAAERQDRRNRFYGKDSDNKQYKRRPHIFLFRSEDLDNEDVIQAIENTPTYKRTRQTLEEIRKQASGNIKKAEDEEQKEAIQGTINFT
jgi:cell division protein FtsZ